MYINLLILQSLPINLNWINKNRLFITNTRYKWLKWNKDFMLLITDKW